MSSSGLILLGAFLAGSLAIILWPLLTESRDKQLDSDVKKMEGLRAQHETILLALRDLDFDKQTGKLNPADYTEQRERLVQSGIEILKQIDALQSELIEAAVAERRAARSKDKDRGRTARRSKTTSTS